MSDASQSSGGGLGCGTVLALIFITLKLTDNIDWSWWWVLAPLWLPIAILAPIIGFLYLAGARA
jgi:hypothetical protein